jgi:PAS domain S-box-containing protein
LDEQGKVRSVIGAFVNITEYIQTEIALRESQALFEAFMRYSPTAAYIKDANGRYLYVNPLNEKICHRPSSEWLGKTDFELFPFEQAQQWQQHDLTALATGQAIEVEETLTQADGEHFFVSFKFPIPQPSGRQLLGGFSLDVTERRRAESRLRESMAILNTVNQATPTLIYVKDRQGRLLMANSATAHWLGQSTTDVIGLTEWDYLNSTEADQIKQNDQQVIETGEVSLFEETVTLPAGTRTFLSTKSPYRDEHGSVIGLIGVSTDITDRKQTERELQRLLASERHYVNQLQGLMTAALAINSALSVEQVLQVITDQAAAIVGAHQSVASMTLNQNWEQSINAICLSDKYAGWREYNEKPDGSGIYACVCHTNHPMRMTQAELEAHPRWQGFGQAASQHPPMRGWLAAPMMGRDGRNIGLIQLSDKYDGDFTEADEAILVQLAQMASVAVENARLYEAEQQARSIAETAREEAQAANRIKDEFLAVLSHELRSPLNPILGWAKLLQMGRLDESRTKQALATIERNAKLQAELIEDLLDVSRILQGKLRLTVGAVDLASTIQAAIETIRLAAEVKFIQIEVDLSPEVGCVSGDSTRLQQVVWNLLSNAVKFTPAEGRVRVSLAAVDHQAQITVTDTGKGISREFLPHVFEYFRQADSATTRQFGGLGLGLAIVRHLVELHGGTIHAESAGEGQGATFVVQLPFMPLQPVGRQQSLLSESSANLQGLLVLVVDDEVDTRELMAFLLEQAGARVIKATSAREALTRLAQFSPDILLSDIGMPDMDGYALMRQIRTLPPEQGGTIPAIALTAYAGEVDQRQAGSAGFQQHIAKPIDPETLVQTIAALLQQGISDRP